MTEKELEGAKKLIENKDVKKGSYSFIGDSNITYADIKILLDYIKQLEQEYQKHKEVIDKAISLLEDDNICADIRRFEPKENENKYGVERELLDILKEVD